MSTQQKLHIDSLILLAEPILAKMGKDKESLEMLHAHIKSRLGLKRLQCNRKTLVDLIKDLKDKELVKVSSMPNFRTTKVEEVATTAKVVKKATAPKKRVRRTKAQIAADNAKAPPKRKRRTKAQMAADRLKTK